MLRLFYVLSWVLFNTIAWAEVGSTIKKDTPTYSINIQYPQEYSPAEINDAIRTYVNTQENDFLQSIANDKGLPAEIPGKNTLTITYKKAYQNKQAISFIFNRSTFYRGAAHPLNTISTWNFIDGKRITLEQVFKPGSNYLERLAMLSRTQLLEKDLEKNQVEAGSKPTVENYNRWYFTPTGLAIVFDTYQVAAYVYGPQTVKIAQEKIAPFIKSDIAKAVWGNK